VTGAVDDLVVDVGVNEVWKLLSDQADSHLIDVRTQAEWAFVGVPDLSKIGKRPLFVEWQIFPEKVVNDRFSDHLIAHLQKVEATQRSNLFFLCRSGVRSREAAIAVSTAGYESCHNVAHGFEGPLDGENHRGRLAGWKASGLPWTQA